MPAARWAASRRWLPLSTLPSWAARWGQAVGEGLVVAARLACDQEATLIAIPASGGARMQEGMLSLIQMPRTVIAVEQVREAGLPYIVILTDPTTGGVSASFAMLGDIQIAEPGAMIGFAGRRVIEDTIREELPEDFQQAERMLDHGADRYGGAAPRSARDADSGDFAAAPDNANRIGTSDNRLHDASPNRCHLRGNRCRSRAG